MIAASSRAAPGSVAVAGARHTTSAPARAVGRDAGPGSCRRRRPRRRRRPDRPARRRSFGWTPTASLGDGGHRSRRRRTSRRSPAGRGTRASAPRELADACVVGRDRHPHRHPWHGSARRAAAAASTTWRRAEASCSVVTRFSTTVSATSPARASMRGPKAARARVVSVGTCDAQPEAARATFTTQHGSQRPHRLAEAVDARPIGTAVPPGGHRGRAGARGPGGPADHRPRPPWRRPWPAAPGRATRPAAARPRARCDDRGRRHARRPGRRPRTSPSRRSTARRCRPPRRGRTTSSASPAGRSSQ